MTILIFLRIEGMRDGLIYTYLANVVNDALLEPCFSFSIGTHPYMEVARVTSGVAAKAESEGLEGLAESGGYG
jgi:hypothetical protein